MCTNGEVNGFVFLLEYFRRYCGDKEWLIYIYILFNIPRVGAWYRYIHFKEKMPFDVGCAKLTS